MNLANVIANRRKELGLSRSKFGRLIDADANTVYVWETGRAKPDFDSLCALVQKAGIVSQSLLGASEVVATGDVGSAA